MFTSIAENDGFAKNEYTLAPNAAFLCQRLQRTPLEPPRHSADCRYFRRSASLDRRRTRPTNRQRPNRALEDGPNMRPPLSIVDTATTCTAGAAAAPAKVGPTWRHGPCVHPEPKLMYLPPSPPLFCPPRRGPHVATTSATLRPLPPRFNRLHTCERVKMARIPRPRGPRAGTYTETSSTYRCPRTSGRPGGDLNWPFSWIRATQRGNRWASAWWACLH